MHYSIQSQRIHLIVEPPRAHLPAPGPFDFCSSAVWFTDWSELSKPPDRHVTIARRYSDVNPMVRPETWLARCGWKRGGGLLRFDERLRAVA